MDLAIPHFAFRMLVLLQRSCGVHPCCSQDFYSPSLWQAAASYFEGTLEQSAPVEVSFSSSLQAWTMPTWYCMEPSKQRKTCGKKRARLLLVGVADFLGFGVAVILSLWRPGGRYSCAQAKERK